MSPRKGFRILSVCDDESIRISRELVLKQEGYEVESYTSNATLNPEKIRSFHVAILCHTLTPARAAEIAGELRASNPAIRLSRVHAIRSRSEPLYDADCEVLAGPGALLTGIETLCETMAPIDEAVERKRA